MDDILSQIKKNDLNGLLQKIEVSGTYVVARYLPVATNIKFLNH